MTIHYDILKRPISVGDIVLTNDYGKPKMELVTVVTKITKKFVFVRVNEEKYDWDKKETYYVDRQMQRKPTDVIVVTEQLAFNKYTYPEAFV